MKLSGTNFYNKTLISAPAFDKVSAGSVPCREAVGQLGSLRTQCRRHNTCDTAAGTCQQNIIGAYQLYVAPEINIR
jgi:hypothetical protein